MVVFQPHELAAHNRLAGQAAPISMSVLFLVQARIELAPTTISLTHAPLVELCVSNVITPRAMTAGQI